MVHILGSGKFGRKTGYYREEYSKKGHLSQKFMIWGRSTCYIIDSLLSGDYDVLDSFDFWKADSFK